MDDKDWKSGIPKSFFKKKRLRHAEATLISKQWDRYRELFPDVCPLIWWVRSLDLAEESSAKSTNIRGYLSGNIKLGVLIVRLAVQRLAEKVLEAGDAEYSRQKISSLTKELKELKKEKETLTSKVKELERRLIRVTSLRRIDSDLPIFSAANGSRVDESEIFVLFPSVVESPLRVSRPAAIEKRKKRLVENFGKRAL